MEWSIRNDYDPGDETLHFGTRAFAESDGCIYEITTIATFQNESKVEHIPALNFGSITNGKLCVCVGSSLTVFSDESSSSVLFSTAFDATIETFVCSPDGNFLIVGLNNGFIHILHIPSEGDPVYAKKMSTKARNGKMFVKIVVDNICPTDVLVVCASGIVIIIQNFDFASFHTAFSNKNIPQMKELTSEIYLATLSGVSGIAPIRSATYFKLQDQLVIFAVGCGIATLPTGLGSSQVSPEAKWLECPSTSTLVKVESTADNSLHLALNSSGQLVLVCPFTLMMQTLPWKHKNAMLDFKLAGNIKSDVSVIAISSSSVEDESCLTLYSYLGSQEKFSLAIGKQSFLLTSAADIEDILFLEFVNNEASQCSTIAIKSANQTVPKFRFERLLARKKFEAAETLARNFGLEMTPLHMARAQNYVEQMQPWSQNKMLLSESTNEIMQKLLSELDKISHLDFVSNCCVSAIPPDYWVAYTLLDYAQKRLQVFFVNNPELEYKVSEWSEKVCGSTLRLETYNLLKSEWNVEEWLDFSATDLLKEVQNYLKQGALSEASIIWSRHKASFKCHLEDEYVVAYLLEDIPSHVTFDKILEWLAHLLPSVLEVQPNALTIIVKWMLSKISDLERSNPKEWPKVGLDYADRCVKLIISQNYTSQFIGLEASPLRPLVVLRCALTDLYTLRSKYYIFVSLDEFSQTPFDVALLLLDYVSEGSISNFISGYLNGYLLGHRLEGDTVISTYIKAVLESSDGWWNWDEAPWESKISTLISHITNYKIRLECINAALENAPVPWSLMINALAEDGLKLKHPMSSQIREKQKQVGTNLILKKYGLKTHINKINRESLLKYIVRQNHADMLSDLAELSHKSVKDYTTVILALFNMGEVSRAVDMLKTLSDDMIVMICPKLILTVSIAVDTDDNSFDNELEFIAAVAHCHEAAKAANPAGVNNIEDLHSPYLVLPIPLESIQNRFRLKRDFRKYLTVSDMSWVSSRENALKEIVSDLLIEVSENETPCQRSNRIHLQAMYAARLLQIPLELALMEVAEQAMNVSDYELATYISDQFDDLGGLPSKLYKRLISIPNLLAKKILSVNDKERTLQIAQVASAAAHHISCQVCCHVEPEGLIEAVESFGWARVWHLVCGRQDISSLGQRDALQSWRFTPLYKDPGMAGFLSGSQLSDFMSIAFNFCKSMQGDSSDVIAELHSSISRLQNDQHDLVVVMIFTQMVTSIIRFSTKHSDKVSALETLLLKSCEVLLTKVAGARQLDKHLSLSLLASMGQEKAVDFLQTMCKSSAVDFQRQKALSCLGSIVTGIWKNPDVYSFFKLLSVQSTWGLRLSELGISAKELLRGRLDSDVVLQKVIGSKNVKSSLLKALCADFKFDFQEVLLTHLRAVLLSFDPDPVININADGTKEMIERNTQSMLLEQCWELQKSIKDKQLLCTTLVSTWEMVNFYHHEVFIVIVEILERLGAPNQNAKRLIPSFLKQYRRVRAPGQDEEEYWTEIFPTSFGLPAISEFRLPYHRRLIDSPLQVIRHEINLSTYKSWLSVANSLDIPKDKICTIAVHQTVTEEFSGYQNNLEWCGTHKYDALFESVAACVAEMDDVVQAAATLYFFMTKVPAGLDQVSVADLCLKYAEIVFSKTGEVEYKLKIEKKFDHLATLQTLHQHGLGQPCYLQLAHNPLELIQKLYQHPTILDLYRGLASHSLDINKAVEDICSIHEICIKTLHMNLVQEWLQPDIVVDCNMSLEDDSYSGMNLHPAKRKRTNGCIASDSSDLSGADDNILRARYVMELGDLQEWAMFLISTVFSSEGNTAMRLRAMKCLCMLTDDETLEDLAGRPMTSIREKFRTLSYLRDLEILGLTYSECGFESCDKHELANLILRTQNHSPRAVAMLVHLCVDYKINQMSLWNSILHQLIELSMEKELERTLEHTASLYQLWTLPNYSKAWNLVLTSAFRNSGTGEDLESVMLHAVTLFPTCPILKSVDVIGALESCLANRRPHIAALLLPYVEKGSVEEWRKKILASKKCDDLLEDLQKIAQDRCINVSKVLNIISIVNK